MSTRLLSARLLSARLVSAHLLPVRLRPALLAAAAVGAALGTAQAETTAQTLVEGLSFDGYKQAIETLASFGDRRRGTERYDRAARWLEATLTKAGYTIERQDYRWDNGSLGAGTRSSLYVTKVGVTSPDEMIIVSAHLDGIGNGGAADDDGSGCALVLEAALAFAGADVRTGRSIRFVFWNDEESPRWENRGSHAYARDRFDRQGIEDPPGSGRYPEPRWIAVIQHDMLLFDHGLPPGPDQIPGADIDIEYQARSKLADEALELARLFQDSNAAYSTDYPAEIGTNMSNTDSVSFMDRVPSISIRENRRVAEIGAGSNPNWHQPTDVYSTYSDADFRLGFNALQMTVAAAAKLAGLNRVSSNQETTE